LTGGTRLWCYIIHLFNQHPVSKGDWSQGMSGRTVPSQSSSRPVFEADPLAHRRTHLQTLIGSRTVTGFQDWAVGRHTGLHALRAQSRSGRADSRASGHAGRIRNTFLFVIGRQTHPSEWSSRNTTHLRFRRSHRAGCTSLHRSRRTWCQYCSPAGLVRLSTIPESHRPQLRCSRRRSLCS
jgi:hypothetical protein